MKKDEALAWREKFLVVASRAGLAEDGKLYHDEADGVARWAQRFSLNGRWPHRAAPDACPGLRYEVWCPQGNSDELRLLLLCDASNGLEALQRALGPVLKDLVEGGRYARRYRPIGAEVRRFGAHLEGIERVLAARPGKAEPAFAQLIEDSFKPIEAAVAAWNADGEALVRFEAACAAYDPLAALKARFGTGK